MLKQVLKILGSIIWDGVKYLATMLLFVVVFSYIFSGCGILLLILFLEMVVESPEYTSDWWVGLTGILVILISWIFLLFVEVMGRIEKLKNIND